MSRQFQYFFGIALLSPIWFIASVLLCFRVFSVEVAINDPGVYPGVFGDVVEHKNDALPSPEEQKLTKIAFDVVCPLVNLWPEDGFPGLSDRGNVALLLMGMATSSMLWAAFLVFMVRFVSKKIGARKLESKQISPGTA